jgi:hypothetical protein
MSDDVGPRIVELCKKLQALLEDAHPGLSAWTTARDQTASQLYDALRDAGVSGSVPLLADTSPDDVRRETPAITRLHRFDFKALSQHSAFTSLLGRHCVDTARLRALDAAERGDLALHALLLRHADELAVGLVDLIERRERARR